MTQNHLWPRDSCGRSSAATGSSINLSDLDDELEEEEEEEEEMVMERYVHANGTTNYLTDAGGDQFDEDWVISEGA